MSDYKAAKSFKDVKKKKHYLKKADSGKPAKNNGPSDAIRLNRFLSNAGICSRREADEYIKLGLVKVNGVVVTELGTKVSYRDEVKYNNEKIKSENKVYILLNKPKDYITTLDDEKGRRTVYEIIKGACRERVFPVGRLDRNTTGLLLFTNDGELSSKLLHPRYNKKKIYHVFLDRNVEPKDIKALQHGIELEDGFVKVDDISYTDPVDKKCIGVEIHSGKNRIIKRMLEYLGYKVIRLDRVYFAGLTKKGLSRGSWRFLKQEEVNRLKMGAYE